MEDDTLYQGLDLERRDPARNLARAYGLQLAPSLFGEIGLVRRWGRIGRPGRLKTDWFEDLGEAKRAFVRKLAEKRRRGYRLRRALGGHDGK